MKKQATNILIPFQNESSALRHSLAVFPAILLFTTFHEMPLYLTQIPLSLCYVVIILACWINGKNSGAVAAILSILTIKFQVADGFFANVVNNSQGLTRIGVFFVIGSITITLLLKIREALVNANKAISLRDEFLDLASHELKTPLTALRLNLTIAQQLSQDANPEAAAKYLLESSHRQVGRLERLVGAMMDITLFESGQLVLALKACNLKTILEDMVAVSGSKLMSISACEDQCIGNWDQTRLEQIISNLLSNAVKYGNNDSIEIVLSRDEKHVWFSVKDNGPGISPEDQRRIFERFQRANLDMNVQGMGLGLYLTKNLVELHKGSITVQSTPGAGSLFTVKLPA